MRTWRIKWVLSQLVHLRRFKQNRAILINPMTFYLGLILKFVPGLFKKTLRFIFKTGDIIKARNFSTLFIYTEIFLDKCYDLPLPENATVIDVGANTGLFALRIKRLYPAAKIICYEPYLPNYHQLVETIHLNKLVDVHPYQKAIADRHSDIRLYIHPTNIGGHSVFENRAGKDWILVKALSIQDVLSLLKGKPCDLLKLDCEGAEYLIIKSLTSETARRIQRIIYEATEGVYGIHDVQAYLESLGYAVQPRHALWVATLIK